MPTNGEEESKAQRHATEGGNSCPQPKQHANADSELRQGDDDSEECSLLNEMTDKETDRAISIGSDELRLDA